MIRWTAALLRTIWQQLDGRMRVAALALIGGGIALSVGLVLALAALLLWAVVPA